MPPSPAVTAAGTAAPTIVAPTAAHCTHSYHLTPLTPALHSYHPLHLPTCVCVHPSHPPSLHLLALICIGSCTCWCCCCLPSPHCYSQSCPTAAPDPTPAVAPTAAVIVVVGGGGTATIADALVAASIAAPAGATPGAIASATHCHQFPPPTIHCLLFIVHVSLPALGLGLCPYSPALFVFVSDTL